MWAPICIAFISPKPVEMMNRETLHNLLHLPLPLSVHTEVFFLHIFYVVYSKCLFPAFCTVAVLQRHVFFFRTVRCDLHLFDIADLLQEEVNDVSAARRTERQ